MASLFYPEKCLNDDIWTIPGRTFEERAPLYIDCTITRTRVNNIIAIVVVLIICISLMFIPFQSHLPRFIIAGIGFLITGGLILGIFMAGRSARLTVEKLAGDYNTWKEGQAPADQNIGKFRTDTREWSYKDTSAANMGTRINIGNQASGSHPSAYRDLGEGATNASVKLLGSLFATKR